MSHYDYLMGLSNLYQQKNVAYGNSAHQTYCRYGRSSYSLRLSDKFQRLENLLSHPEIDVADESINDTIGDAICYCCMFAADILCESSIPDFGPNNEANIEKTISMLQLLACCNEVEITDMSVVFQDTWDNSHSLTDVIYDMYSDPKTGVLDYIMLAAHLVCIYNEREREN